MKSLSLMDKKLLYKKKLQLKNKRQRKDQKVTDLDTFAVYRKSSISGVSTPYITSIFNSSKIMTKVTLWTYRKTDHMLPIFDLSTIKKLIGSN